MKRAKQFFVLGLVGLFASLANFFFSEMNYDPIPYLAPWIVFLIIGFTTWLKYVKK